MAPRWRSEALPPCRRAGFVDLSGGPEARIAILPTASSLPDSGRKYEKVFRSLGAKRARAVPFERRADYQRRYARASGLDLADLDYFEVFSWWKYASIVEGVYARRLAG